jgi:hypothetical protein
VEPGKIFLNQLPRIDLPDNQPTLKPRTYASVIFLRILHLSALKKVSWASRPWLFSVTKTTGETPVIQVFQNAYFLSLALFIQRASSTRLVVSGLNSLITFQPLCTDGGTSWAG